MLNNYILWVNGGLGSGFGLFNEFKEGSTQLDPSLAHFCVLCSFNIDWSINYQIYFIIEKLVLPGVHLRIFF